MVYEPFNILNLAGFRYQLKIVDTDQIIPARFLKATERKGFGDNLFRDWRYHQDGKENKKFCIK